MNSLFSSLNEKNAYRPLADKLRPNNLSDILGQEHLLGKNMPIYEMVRKNSFPSIVFYGPSGTGKTTIAHAISKETDCDFITLNAVVDGIAKIKEVLVKARNNREDMGIKTILFVDEIHRFNKIQQDALLPYVENGEIILIGATTENPYISINKALLSRVMLFEVKLLKKRDIRALLRKTIEDEINGYGNTKIVFEDEDYTFKTLIDFSGGDARIALNILENIIQISKISHNGILIEKNALSKLSAKKVFNYDKNGDNHYDVISAFIKSIRGSDPDAAIHYLARMIESGEDPLFIARRLVISASEDIGLGDKEALGIAMSSLLAVEKVGLPEARINLAHATIYLSLANKSNSAYLAINAAIEDFRNSDCGEIPTNLRDKNYTSIEIKNSEYLYPHDYPDKDFKVLQKYLPEKLKDKKYYFKKKFDKF